VIESEVEVSSEALYGVIDTLYHTIQERKNADPSSSWTAKLLSKGDNAILKKVVEEAGEFSFACKDNDAHEIIYEAADLTYHVLVALAAKNISTESNKACSQIWHSGIAEKTQEIQMAIQKLSEFIKNLIIYDYILFGSLLALFLLFIILGIIFRHRLGVALFLVFFAFFLLLGGATFGYKAMHDYLFKNETVLISQKKLSFTQAAVVYGTLKNVSKKDFKSLR
jgi:phosphoribosyl-ATP pyrophosphohydrolase